MTTGKREPCIKELEKAPSRGNVWVESQICLPEIEFRMGALQAEGKANVQTHENDGRL